MKNLTLKVRVVQANAAELDINGYIYNMCIVEVGNIPEIKAYVPNFTRVSEGDCLVTESWKITRYEGETDFVDLVIRIDELSICDSKDFEVSPYLNSIVQGEFIKSAKCALKAIGPGRKPLLLASLKFWDEYSQPYTVLLAAFCNPAKRLAETPSHVTLKAEVTIKRKQTDPGYEMAIVKYDVLEEEK